MRPAVFVIAAGPFAVVALVGLTLGLVNASDLGTLPTGLFLGTLPVASLLVGMAMTRVELGPVRWPRRATATGIGCSATAWLFWILLFILPFDGPGVEDLGNILALLFMGALFEFMALSLVVAAGIGIACARSQTL